ncbi:hypothetical protein [Streptomyces sp. NPDC086787]|uniref:allene oxide cyclase barrel-like domain-containing protein n=1 Tax=Streptomyces sp. NPDC086787 TaxID=3365759 RepID=UPI00380E6DB1
MAAAAALATVPAGVASAVGGGGGGGGDKETVLEITTEATDRYGFPLTDVPVGHGFGIAGNSTSTATGGAYGTFGSACVVQRVEETYLVTNCVETFETPRGQITTQGIKNEPTDESPLEFKEAVTGGTGDFAHATGYACFEEQSDHSYRITFHLQLDNR